jgi:hypothetical protein
MKDIEIRERERERRIKEITYNVPYLTHIQT